MPPTRLASGPLPGTLALETHPAPLTSASVGSWPRRLRRLARVTAPCPPPGTGETPTLGTLDFYMARLHGAIERDPAQHEKLIVRIKEILAQVARCVPRRVTPGTLRGPRGAALRGGLGGHLGLDLPWAPRK